MNYKMLFAVLALLFVVSCVPNTSEPITEDDLPPDPLPPGTAEASSGDFVGQAFYPYEEGYSSPYDVYEDNFQSQLFYISPSQFDLDLLTQTFDINVRVEHDNGIVYKTGYIHTRNGWEPYDFPQNRIGSSNWIRNNAKTIVSLDRDVFNDGTSWILAYSCKKHNGQWRCGAQYIGDSQGHWMLNSFFVRTVNQPLSPPGLGQPVLSELRMSPTNRLVKLGDTIDIYAYLESVQNVVHNIDDVNVLVREPTGGEYFLNLGFIHKQPFNSNTCTPLSGLYDYSVNNGCREWAHYHTQFTPQDVGDYAIESQGLTLSDLRVDDGSFRVLQPWQFEQHLVNNLVTAPGVEFIPEQSYGYYYTEANEFFQTYTVSDTNRFNVGWMEANVNEIFDQNNYRITRFEENHNNFNEIVVNVDGQDHYILQQINVHHSSFNSQTTVSWAWKAASNDHVIRLNYWSDLNSVVDVTELVREYLRKFPTDLTARTSATYAQYLIEQDIAIYDYKQSSFHEWAELRLSSQIGDDDMYVARYEDFISLYNVEKQQATVMVYDPQNNVEAGLRDALDILVAESNGQVNYWPDTKLDTNDNSHNVYIITGDSESVVWASNNYIVWIGNEHRNSAPYSEDVVSAYLTMHESTMTGISSPTVVCDLEAEIKEGILSNHILNGKNYQFELVHIDDDEAEFEVTFDTNVERTPKMVVGNQHVFSDSSTLKLNDIDYFGGSNTSTGTPPPPVGCDPLDQNCRSDSATICFNDPPNAPPNVLPPPPISGSASFKIEDTTTPNKLNLYEKLGAVVLEITENDWGFLSSGTITSSGVTSTYTQKIGFNIGATVPAPGSSLPSGHSREVIFAESDSDVLGLHLFFEKGEPMAVYTMEFSPALTSQVDPLGVGDFSGPTAFATIDILGKTYDVSGICVPVTTACDGIELTLSRVGQTIVLRDASFGLLKVNNEDIESADVAIDYMYNGLNIEIQSFTIVMNAEEDYYVRGAERLSEIIELAGKDEEVLFTNNWDIEYAGIARDVNEIVDIKKSGNDKYRLQFENSVGLVIDVPFAYSGIADEVRFGDDTSRLVLDPRSVIEAGDYFILTDANSVTNIVQYAGADNNGLTFNFQHSANSGTSTTVTYSRPVSAGGVAGTGSATLSISGTPFTITNAAADSDASGLLIPDFPITLDDISFQQDVGVYGTDGIGEWTTLFTRYDAQITLRDADIASSTNPLLFRFRDDSGNVFSADVTGVGNEVDLLINQPNTVPLTAPDGTIDHDYGYSKYGTYVDLFNPTSGPREVTLLHPSEESEAVVYLHDCSSGIC
jgi:hypothetical protein